MKLNLGKTLASMSYASQQGDIAGSEPFVIAVKNGVEDGKTYAGIYGSMLDTLALATHIIEGLANKMKDDGLPKEVVEGLLMQMPLMALEEVYKGDEENED